MSDIYSTRVQFPTCVSAAWGAALTLHDHLVHDDDNDDYDDDGDNDDGDNDDVADHGVDDDDHLAHDDGDKNYEDDNETNTNCTCSGSIADPTSHRVQWSLLWYWFIPEYFEYLKHYFGKPSDDSLHYLLSILWQKSV